MLHGGLEVEPLGTKANKLIESPLPDLNCVRTKWSHVGLCMLGGGGGDGLGEWGVSVEGGHGPHLLGVERWDALDVE